MKVSVTQNLVLAFRSDLKRVCISLSFSFSYIYIYTNSSAQAGYDTRSIFKWSLTGLNSEFSFSLTSCLTKAEEPSLPCYLPIVGGRIIPKDISAM